MLRRIQYPPLGTTTAPGGASSVKLPHDPNLTTAMVPVTTARVSRIKKSIIGLPIPLNKKQPNFISISNWGSSNKKNNLHGHNWYRHSLVAASDSQKVALADIHKGRVASFSFAVETFRNSFCPDMVAYCQDSVRYLAVLDANVVDFSFFIVWEIGVLNQRSHFGIRFQLFGPLRDKIAKIGERVPIAPPWELLSFSVYQSLLIIVSRLGWWLWLWMLQWSRHKKQIITSVPAVPEAEIPFGFLSESYVWLFFLVIVNGYMHICKA